MSNKILNTGNHRVFVDCDRTLVNTEIYPLLSKAVFDNRPKFFFRWNTVLTEARPSAKSFLQELGSKYEVAMLTLGHSKFQTKVLKELGLADLVGDIYGPDNCDLVPKTNGFVLVDDMEPHSLAIAYKMRWLGHQKGLENLRAWPEKLALHIVQCHPFMGGKEDSEPLTDLLPSVHERMTQMITEADQQA
ncbi:hypothetical protein BH11CYA1_BH11CYA1_20270 [soil metagenome]